MITNSKSFKSAFKRTLVLAHTVCLCSCSMSSLPIWSKRNDLRPYDPNTAKLNAENTPGNNAKSIKLATKQSDNSLSIKGPIEISADSESDREYLDLQDPKIAETQNTEQEPTGEVEITWLVPESEVDGFIVEYGFSELLQDQQVKIKTSELTKTNDAANGSVYRYILKNIPQENALYIKIAAYKGELTSVASPILHVK